MIELAKKIILRLIRFYQKTLSFDHGWLSVQYPHGYCRFYPTCSEYGYKAINKYGLIKGGIRMIWRLLRCSPFSKGGIDLLK
jgi:putative membrane protein insertion efficiency factor